MKKKLPFLKRQATQVFLFLFAIIAVNFSAQTSATFDSGTGVWYVPCGVTSITVEAWGGGGKGGKITKTGEGGGGGGGAYSRIENISVSTGDSFNYKVGNGGVGNTLDGGDSWFSSDVFLKAKGGKGVLNDSKVGADGGLASESRGTVRNSGGRGGNTRDGGILGDKAGGGGGAGHLNGRGGDASDPDEGGGLSVSPGGFGANGGGRIAGAGYDGNNYGGGGGGAISRLGIDREGGKGGGGYIRITYVVPVGTVSPIGKIENIVANPGTDIGCKGTEVTLQANGGNVGSGVSTLWYENTGICPSFKYIQEFMQPSYPTSGTMSVSNTTVGSLVSGNRTFTSISNDPQIDMLNVLSKAIENPTQFKYITIRYRVVSGTGGNVQIYFSKKNSTLGEDKVVTGAINSDKQWHIINIDMSRNLNWKNDGGDITGWRLDYASNPDVTMEIDYLVLGNVPILENINNTESTITLNPEKASTSYAAVRIADQQAQCNNTVPVTGCAAITINRMDRTFTAATGNWSTAANWFPGNVLPTLNNCVNIPTDKNVVVDIATAQAGTLKVQSSGKIEIQLKKTLTVQSEIVNNGNGTNFVINEGGNLVQIENGAINTGSITAQKVFTFTKETSDRQQYNYVISPVVGQNLKTIYPGNPATLYYIESTNYFGTSNGSYIPGRSLAVKEPATTAVSSQTVTAEFKGVPFNGVIEFPLTHKQSNPRIYGYNLVGNPYPSSLNIQSLYNHNNANIDPTFEFWDNRKNARFIQDGSKYSGDNYAKFNAINSTGVAAGGEQAKNDIDASRIPTEFVNVGTGFLVRAKSTANGKMLVFNNTMRSKENGSSFFGKEGSRDRYWLAMITPSEMQFMTAVVYFAAGDNGFGLDDSKASNSSDRIYSVVEDNQIAIQGRATFVNTDKVDLGISAYASGKHTIQILNKEGVFANKQAIYLKDKQTGVITNLSKGSYTFEANQGETTGRFEIIYQPETVLVTDQKVKSTVEVYRDSNQFVIRSPKNIAMVEVYDLSGKMITVLKDNSRQVVLDASFLTKGMYVLRIKMTDGELTTKKIIK